MSSRKKAIAVGGTAALIAIGYMATSQHETSLSSEKPATLAAISTERDAVVPPSDATASAPAPGLAAPHHDVALAQPKTFEATGEQREALAAYAKIRHKVFLTESDKKERARLLGSREFLKSLLPIVTASTANNLEDGDAQNNALDLLYDALAGEGKDAAAQVLGQIVQDNQVENKDLPLKDRENLAGVKAEALYEWTARDPGAAARVPAMLPGKVSQQLWQNVQTRQQRNLASSAEEAAKK